MSAGPQQVYSVQTVIEVKKIFLTVLILKMSSREDVDEETFLLFWPAVHALFKLAV